MQDRELDDVPAEPLLPEPLRKALGRLYDEPAPIPDARQAAMIGAAVRRFRARQRLRRVIWRAGPFVAAAGVILAVILSFIAGGRPALADIYADAAKAGEAWFRCATVLSPGLPLDDSDYHSRLADLTRLKERRDRARSAYVPETSDHDPLYGELLHAWQAYYVALRDLGLRDQAVAECRAAIEFTEHNPTGRGWLDWKDVYLDGLGSIYALFGEYENAREAYIDSIRARLRSAPWDERPTLDETIGVEEFSTGVMHIYWRLVLAALGEDDLDEAEAWQSRATHALTSILRRDARTHGIALPAGATAWDIFQRLPNALSEDDGSRYRRVWLRVHLLYEARLQRLGGELDEAERSLERAASLPDAPLHDEYRLPLLLPIEQARLAIARRQYARALDYVAEAARNSGPLVIPGQPHHTKPAAGPLVEAELALLRGVALLGIDSTSREGARLVTEAAKLPEKLSRSLPPERRAPFLSQFESWRKLIRTHHGSGGPSEPPTSQIRRGGPIGGP